MYDKHLAPISVNIKHHYLVVSTHLKNMSQNGFIFPT